MDLAWWEVALRLLGAAALGGVLGIEREADGHEAGLRTHMLLALGAGLFAVASVDAFDPFISENPRSNVQFDPSRIASYVAAGIGFLGGGAILKHEHRIRGLTTAASLWAAAAVGLSAGLGFWAGAISASAIALLALAGLKPLSNWLARISGREVSDGS